MASLVGIVLIAVIATIDNALLAGLLVPVSWRKQKKNAMIIVGILLALSQIFLAASVDQLLHNVFFRVIGILLLSWMCIRTLGIQPTRRFQTWTVTLKLWLYTVVGNLDNMFWLGSELKGHLISLVASSVGLIPLFVAVAVFLSDQCEKKQWILPLGAGMMAWAAASLMLDIPFIQTIIGRLDDAPRTTIQCLITIVILVLGLGVRQFMRSFPTVKP